MNSLAELLSNRAFYIVLIVYWLVTAAIGAMPMPDSKDGKGYKWFFSFAHIFAGNLNRAAVALRVPGANP